VRTIHGRAAAARIRRGGDDRETADVVPLRAGNAQPAGPGELLEVAALGGIGVLVLLVTCATASTLLVGVAVARRREIAVRLSLGAARVRLVRQLLTESTLLALVAGALGLLVTYVLIRVSTARIPDFHVVVAWPTVVFMVGIALATGVLFGSSPAVHATRLAVSEVLKDAAAAVSASRSWLQRGLVVAQIGLTQPMLVGLGAFLVVAVAELRGRPETSALEHVVSVQFNPFTGAISGEQARATMDGLRARLAGVPGVVGVVPAADGYSVARVVVHPADRVGGTPDRTLQLRLEGTAPGYFALLDAPIVSGRAFAPDDATRRPRPIVIGSDMARNLWATTDPVGRRLVSASEAVADSSTFVVVGVVDAAAAGASEGGSQPRVFVPHRARSFQRTLLVRTAGPAAAMLPTIRRVAAAEAPQVPITEATTLAAIEREMHRFVLQASGAAAAGGLFALFLSAIGLFAVVAFAVGQRTREIGIRTALGADRRRVVGAYFAGGLRLGLLGLALGLPLSLVALRVIATQIGAPRVSIPVVAALIATFVLLVASIATWLPARRAARVDPLIALRSE
jgi:putative ABC transport system permease protein